MQSDDEPDEQYKRYIPANFYMGLFFYLSRKRAGKTILINKLKPGTFPRGFQGVVIFSADGVDQRKTGRFYYFPEWPSSMKLAQFKGKTLISQDGVIGSDSQEISPNKHTLCLFNWSESNFAIFAFDLLAVMNGTHKPGTLNSLHGIRA